MHQTYLVLFSKKESLITSFGMKYNHTRSINEKLSTMNMKYKRKFHVSNHGKDKLALNVPGKY